MRHPQSRAILKSPSLILIIFWAILVCYGQTASNSQIVLKARYQFSTDRMIWSFPVFYGIPGENINQLYVRFHFHYLRTIFISDEIYHNGVTCTIDFDCDFKPTIVYIFDPTGKRELGAHSGTIGFYFKPPEVQMFNFSPNKMSFYLNASDPNFLKYNVIGLQAHSDFWQYLIKFYFHLDHRIILFFETDVRATNFMTIQEDLSRITTTMTLNPSNDIKRFLTVTSKDGFMVGSTEARFGDFCFNTVATFSYEIPYIMKLNTQYYQKLIDLIKKIICIKPESCESDSDIYTNIYTKEKLTITFENEINPMVTETFSVTFPIKELFFITPNGQIAYNFVSYKPQQSSQNVVIFGLLFLKKCNVMLSYNRHTEEYELFLSAKESSSGGIVTQLFVFLSVLLSVVVTVGLIRVSPSYEKEVLISRDQSLTAFS